jgi:hypothetical protein
VRRLVGSAILGGALISRYCFVGVFSVGPCRYDEATLGATTNFPEAYVMPGLDTIVSDGGVATELRVVFDGLFDDDGVVGIDRLGLPPRAVTDAIAAEIVDDAAAAADTMADDDAAAANDVELVA